MRRFGDWTAQSLRYSSPFTDIDTEPTSSYFGAIGDPTDYWTDARFEVTDDNVLEIRAARWFDQPGSDRDWELGQLRKMVVSFSDRYNQIYQNSDENGIDLILFTGYKTKLMMAREAEERAELEDTLSAVELAIIQARRLNKDLSKPPPKFKDP